MALRQGSELLREFVIANAHSGSERDRHDDGVSQNKVQFTQPLFCSLPESSVSLKERQNGGTMLKRETPQERDEWLEAIARDDRRQDAKKKPTESTGEFVAAELFRFAMKLWD